MKKVVFNKYKIKDSEVSEIVVRLKAFIVDDNKNILLAKSNGGFQLPGGHLEKNETLEQGLIREIKEEAGIFIEPLEIQKCFYEISYYIKSNQSNKKNIVSKIIYYYIKTNKKPDLSNIDLTEEEKNNDFGIFYVNISDFEKTIKDMITMTDKKINKIIGEEILEAFKIFKQENF